MSKFVKSIVGNELEKEYDVDKKHQVGSAGSGFSWKIYNATKKTSKERTAAFYIFHKDGLKKEKKDTQERILEQLRREVAILTKIRHPGVLRVITPLIEHKQFLAFVTEPLFGSLGNIYGHLENFKNPPERILKFSFLPLEVKTEFLTLCETIEFLHEDAGIVHNNISFGSILVTKDGSWKLAGFQFSKKEGQNNNWDFHEAKSQSSMLPLHPDPDYSAPELMAGESYPESDSFSVASIMYEILTGKKLFNIKDRIQIHKSIVEKNSEYNSGLLPDDLKDVLSMMLVPDPDTRLSIKHFLRVPYFKDTAIRCLRFLGDIVEKDLMTKVTFFKGIPKVVELFHTRILNFKVLPPLISEMENEKLVPLILNILFIVAEKQTVEEFRTHTMDAIVSAAGSKLVDSVVIIIRNIKILYEKTPKQVFMDNFLYTLFNGLKLNNAALQEESLKQLDSMVEKLDYSFIREEIYPRLCDIIFQSDYLNVKVASLITLNKIVKDLDREAVDKLLPDFGDILTTDKRPAIQMSLLGVIDSISKNQGADYTALKILPIVIPGIINPELSKKQFYIFTTIIREMLNRVETEKSKIYPEEDADNPLESPREGDVIISRKRDDGREKAMTFLGSFDEIIGLESGPKDVRAPDSPLPFEREKEPKNTKNFVAPTNQDVTKTNNSDDSKSMQKKDISKKPRLPPKPDGLRMSEMKQKPALPPKPSELKFEAEVRPPKPRDDKPRANDMDILDDFFGEPISKGGSYPKASSTPETGFGDNLFAGVGERNANVGGGNNSEIDFFEQNSHSRKQQKAEQMATAKDWSVFDDLTSGSGSNSKGTSDWSAFDDLI